MNQIFDQTAFTRLPTWGSDARKLRQKIAGFDANSGEFLTASQHFASCFQFEPVQVVGDDRPLDCQLNPLAGLQPMFDSQNDLIPPDRNGMAPPAHRRIASYDVAGRQLDRELPLGDGRIGRSVRHTDSDKGTPCLAQASINVYKHQVDPDARIRGDIGLRCVLAGFSRTVARHSELLLSLAAL